MGTQGEDGSEEITTAVGDRLLFENDRLRVWTMTLKPGEASPLHRHLHDYAIVYASPGDMEVRHADGTRTAQPSPRGHVAFQDVGPGGLMPHELRNVGETTSTHYIVELLEPGTASSLAQA